jgi:hypothetical protein
MSHRGIGPVDRMGVVLEYDAILAFAAGDSAALASSFRDAMAFRSLAFRWHVFLARASRRTSTCRSPPGTP